MNKKDVLGASADAGNIQKMESMPHPIQIPSSAGNAHFPALNRAGTAGSFGVSGI